MKASAISLVFAAIALVGGCGGSEPPVPPGVLSISALPALDPYPQTSAEVEAVFREALDLARSAGARGQVSTYTWSSLEPDAGGFDPDELQKLDADITSAFGRGDLQFLGVQLINTTNREMPSDLSALPFDDARVIARFHALLDRLITPHVGRIRYLSIGNEVDVYLSVHPDEWPRYRALYEDAVSYAHGLDPALKVGVTATAEAVQSTETANLALLNSTSDVVIVTYYPLQADLQVSDPRSPTTDFPALLALAGAKPLVFQEAGYPAAASLGSSEALQADFIGNVFAAWKNAGGRIPLLNVFLLHDFTPQLCADFGLYYGQPDNTRFIDFLCTLGLRQDDGRPRESWNRLLDEADRAGF